MKKDIIKVVTLLLFASIALSSCEVQYRERSMYRHNRDWHDGYDRRYDHDGHYDHHYDNDYHRY